MGAPGIEELLRRAAADGLFLTIDDDRLVVRGNAAARERWRPVLAQSKTEILGALRDAEPAYLCWTLYFADRDDLAVTFSPPVTRDEALRQYPDALAAIPVPDPPPPPRGCSTCRHRTRFDNCAVPVEAGLAETFQLAKHPAGGEGCTVFEPKPIAAEHRVAALLEAGLLDADDADLVRLRYADDPDQWGQLLDAIERDAGRQA